MIHKRTIKEVRRYDIFKLSIILLLLVLIFIMLLRDNDEISVATSEDETTASEVDESTTSDESAGDTTAEEAYPIESDAAEDEADATSEEAYPGDSETAKQEDSFATSETAVLTPAQGAELKAGPNIFSGSGEPDSIISVLADGSELGQATVDANGNWYLEVSLEAGEPVIEIQTLDSDGNVVASAPPMTITVTAVDPVLNQPDLVLNEMNLYAGSVELSGSGEPGYQVAIFANGEEAGTVEVEEDGTWNLPLDVEAGSSTISLQTLDKNGVVLNESGPFEVAVQEAVLPTVALPADDVFAGGMTLSGTGQPGTKVQLYANETVIGESEVDANGNYTIEIDLAVGRYNIDVATLDKSGNAQEIVPALSLPVLALVMPQINIADGETPEFDLLSGLVAWHGTADPGAQLVLVVDGEAIAQFTADHEISLQQLDIEGNVVYESKTITVELDQKPPTLDLPDYSIAESEESEQELEQSIQLPSGAFEWRGQGEADESVAIIIDGEVVGTVTVDEDGNWAIPTDLEAGDHEVQIGTVDENGNVTIQSTPKDLKVAAISLPFMETPQLDDSGKGSISGTADPDAIVTVNAISKVVGITSADENGNWTLNVDLGSGSFELQAQVLDEDGTVVLSSAKISVEIGVSSEPQEEDDVIDAAVAAGEFSMLLSGLESTGLTGRLSESDEAFTLFAPTDAAFDALPDEVIAGWNSNPEAYKEIMFYLVLEGAYTQEELAETQVLTTLAGTNIGITADDDVVSINGVPLEATVPAGNSIVHAIDQVILPPLGYQAQPPIIDISGVSIFTGDYLTVVGTAEPGTIILLQVSGENFGDLATVDDTGFWQTSDYISSGVHDILAYMLDENGLLLAISQQVSLPVQ
jgi:uncharacterized surface protein with fasciclin (FAS1) repeats